MNTKIIIPAFLAIMFLVGCGKNTGYVIKPMPIDETLEETTVIQDDAFFVKDKIVIIDVEGLLMNAKSSSLFGSGENPVTTFIEKIDKAQADPDVKAVVLRINSPGGGVTASDIMYQHVMRFKRVRKVPVIAIFQDVAASGGYYVACSADHIIAMPTSVTGSIGVIVNTISFAGTLDKIGVTTKAITSGKFKDMGSPLKPLDKEDQAIIQNVVDQFYEGFVQVVASGRPNMKIEKIRELADGRVYTGRQAQANGLVDSLGYVEDAVRLAKEKSGSRKVKVVLYNRPLGYKANIYSDTQTKVPQANLNVNMPNMLELLQPQFLYLWTGQAAKR